MSEQHEKELLKKIILNIPNYVFWKDAHLFYRGCNYNFVKYAGYKKPEDIIGKTDFELPWGIYTAKIYQIEDQNILRTGKPILHKEVPMVMIEGENKVLSVSKVPLYDDENNIIGILGFYTDITKQKMQETALKRALSVKSEFIANMSHDIRTPITGILGLAQSLKDHSEGETNREEAQLLIGATEQLLSLLNEIIEVVQIEEGKLTNGQKDFDLIAIVENNIELLQPALRDKGLHLNYQIEPAIPRYLFGYRLYLDRILLNLLSNAIKFTEKGQISLMFSIKEIKEVQEKVVLQIVVEDTGIGIPAEKKEAIFEHFSRLSPSYDGRYKGYGLGLYTVKHYLEAMQGRIEVDSQLGKGSRFILTIPFKIGKKVTSKITRVFETDSSSIRFSSELVKKNEDEEKTPLEKKPEKIVHILLVEDSALAALMATRLLAERNCEIMHVKTGTDALEYAAKEYFDLILMDLGLPDQSGFDVTRKIRANTDHLNVETPIVALTGHMSSDKRKECLALGMQDMITKPLTALTGQQLLATYVTASTPPKMSQRSEAFTELSAIDLEDGTNILGGDMASAKEALDLLAQSLPLDYQQIQAHYNAKDYEALYHATHKLYGGLCYCGTPGLREASRLLKQALLDKRIQKLPSLKWLSKEIERFLQAYKHLKLQDDF